MKIFIASDSWKGCLDSNTVNKVIAQGLSAALPHARIECAPMADGGEGTIRALGCREVDCETTDPLGRSVKTCFGLLDSPDGSVAVIESASAAGMKHLTPSELNPLEASSYGLGKIIRSALACNPRELIFTLGDTAVMDCGYGLLRALGGSMTETSDGTLEMTYPVEVEGLAGMRVTIAADVLSPLTGKSGSVAVFGSQKGVTPEQSGQFGRYFTRCAELFARKRGVSISEFDRYGAAGGIGAMLSTLFPQAKLCSGADMVMEYNGLAGKMAAADLVVTGEGCFDGQTSAGKVVAAVIRNTRSVARRRTPTFAVLCGRLIASGQQSTMQGIDHAIQVSAPDAIADGSALLPSVAIKNIYNAAYRMGREFIKNER